MILSLLHCEYLNSHSKIKRETNEPITIRKDLEVHLSLINRASKEYY